MAINTQIERITTAANTIKTKLIDLGLVDSTAKIDTSATAINSIKNNGAVTVNVKEGETYTIPAGWHNGGGTVSGVAGGGNYTLQEKTVTPTKEQQSIASDEGYYGLSSVVVSAIPAQYQDVSSVTAAAENVLAGKVIVDSTGKVITGTMTNNGAVSKTLDISTTSYTVPAGYHDGKGTVTLVTEEKSVTPTKAAQEIVPTTGKVLSKVNVAAIPDEYIITTDATATADKILLDETAYVGGVKLTGTMTNNGDVTATIDGLTKTEVEIPAGYTTGGKISLTDDIETLLAAI